MQSHLEEAKDKFCNKLDEFHEAWGKARALANRVYQTTMDAKRGKVVLERKRSKKLLAINTSSSEYRSLTDAYEKEVKEFTEEIKKEDDDVSEYVGAWFKESGSGAHYLPESFKLLGELDNIVLEIRVSLL